MIFGERDRGNQWLESQSRHLPIEEGESASEYFQRLCEFYNNPDQRKLLEGCCSVAEISLALKILDGRVDVTDQSLQWATMRMQRASSTTPFGESRYVIDRDYYNEIIGGVNVAKYEITQTRTEAIAAYRERIRNELTGRGDSSGCNPVNLFWRSVSKTVLRPLHPAAKEHLLDLVEREVTQRIGYPEEVKAASSAAAAYDRLSKLIDTPITLAQYNNYIHDPVKTGLAYKYISPTVMNELANAMMLNLGIEQ